MPRRAHQRLLIKHCLFCAETPPAALVTEQAVKSDQLREFKMETITRGHREQSLDGWDFSVENNAPIVLRQITYIWY